MTSQDNDNSGGKEEEFDSDKGESQLQRPVVSTIKDQKKEEGEYCCSSLLSFV